MNEKSGIGDLGFVSSSLKATHAIANDRIKLLVQGSVLIIGLVGMFAVGFSSGIAKEQKRSEEDRKQLVSIEESFADGRDFTLFGQYKIWRGRNNAEYCYSVRASR